MIDTLEGWSDFISHALVEDPDDFDYPEPKELLWEAKGLVESQLKPQGGPWDPFTSEAISESFLAVEQFFCFADGAEPWHDMVRLLGTGGVTAHVSPLRSVWYESWHHWALDIIDAVDTAYYQLATDLKTELKEALDEFDISKAPRIIELYSQADECSKT